MTRPAARPWLVTVESLDWLGDPCFVVTVERRGQTRIQAVDDTAAGALAIALAQALLGLTGPRRSRPAAFTGRGAFGVRGIMGQTNQEAKRQADELARLPIGTSVMVRGADGMGLGTVREHVTANNFSDGRSIPLIGWAQMVVWFWDDYGGQPSIFKSSELYAPPQHKAIRGTWQNIRHLRNRAAADDRDDVVALCDEAERFGAGSRAYTLLCAHLTSGVGLPEVVR